MVILDFAKDWRFKENNFGQYGQGFYVSSAFLMSSLHR